MDSREKHIEPAQQQGDDQLTCKELVELVTAYREDALPPKDRARFDAHLSVCPPCVTYVEQIDTTMRSLGALDEQIAVVEQEPATQELLRVFRTWKADKQP
ncbi:MAG: zf-HC2 domain-containing protein [Ktedonobacterales bacterium]